MHNIRVGLTKDSIVMAQVIQEEFQPPCFMKVEITIVERSTAPTVITLEEEIVQVAIAAPYTIHRAILTSQSMEDHNR